MEGLGIYNLNLLPNPRPNSKRNPKNSTQIRVKTRKKTIKKKKIKLWKKNEFIKKWWSPRDTDFNFEGGTEFPILNLKGGPGIPHLNFQGVSGLTILSSRVLLPLSHFYTRPLEIPQK